MIVRTAVVGAITLVVTAALTPLAGRVARRTGLVAMPREGRAHTIPTPYLGGVAMLAVILAALSVARSSLEREFHQQLVVIGLAAAAMGVVGLIDDWRPNLPRYRLVVETGAAFAVAGVGVQLQVTRWVWVNVTVTIVWIVGITNAVNLLDNMDGLAAGAVAIAGTGAAVLALTDGQELVSLLAIATSAASLGFLLHNRPPARIFMGDAGALSLGFLIAVTAAKLELLRYPGPKRMAIVVLLCGVGILDTGLVVVSRVARGVSPMTGGTDHASHRLVRAGLTPRRAVLVLHVLGGWFAAAALAVHLAPDLLGAGVAALTGVGAVLVVVTLFRLPAEGPLYAHADVAEPAATGAG